jgi:hypothetical protein
VTTPLIGASRTASGSSNYSLMAGALPLISPDAISKRESAAQMFPVYLYARAELGLPHATERSLGVSGVRLGVEGSLRLADVLSPPAPTPPTFNDYMSFFNGTWQPSQGAISATAYLKGKF